MKALHSLISSSSRQVGSAASLNELAEMMSFAFLQSETQVKLRVEGSTARWTYVVTDGSSVGRQKSEILALGYMLDLMRKFLGPRSIPVRATVPGSAPRRGDRIEL